MAKESFKDRLRLLFIAHNLRQASGDWDLAYSTLNNYLARGAEPALNVAKKILATENVSLAWLAGDGSEKSMSFNTSHQEPVSDTKQLNEFDELMCVLSRFSDNEVRSLLNNIY